jgi:hypothetical protein
MDYSIGLVKKQIPAGRRSATTFGAIAEAVLLFVEGEARRECPADRFRIRHRP